MNGGSYTFIFKVVNSRSCEKSDRVVSLIRCSSSWWEVVVPLTFVAQGTSSQLFDGLTKNLTLASPFLRHLQSLGDFSGKVETPLIQGYPSNRLYLPWVPTSVRHSRNFFRRDRGEPSATNSDGGLQRFHSTWSSTTVGEGEAPPSDQFAYHFGPTGPLFLANRLGSG